MFGRLRGMFKASEATGIMKQAFKSLGMPVLPFDPDALSLELVTMSYRAKPDMFDGKHGKPPHPRATAAVSLAAGLTYEDYGYSDTARQCVCLALGNVLLEASANMARYGFSVLDIRLLRLAEAAYLEHAEKNEARTSAIVGDFGL